MDVVIFIGSESDHEVVKDALHILEDFGVSHRLEVTSAHRSPERTRALIAESEKKGAKVFIAGAGRAALLAVQILSLKNPRLKKRLEEHKKAMAAQVESASKKIQKL